MFVYSISNSGFYLKILQNILVNLSKVNIKLFPYISNVFTERTNLKNDKNH